MNKKLDILFSFTLGLLALVGVLSLVGAWESGLSISHAQSGTGTIRVAATGADSVGCGSVISPCRTIQYAVDQAVAGEEILVASGVYTPGVAEQVVDISKNITIRGGYSSGFTETNPISYPTTLDAQGNGRGVYVHVAGVNATLEGLRITGGDATGLGSMPGYGGGVLAYYGAYDNKVSATISDCVIYSNTANTSGIGYGGGVSIRRHVNITINNSQVLSNTASGSNTGYGGGIYIYNFSFLTVTHSLIENNVASISSGGRGGGIYVEDTSTIEDNTIQGNRATDSGAWGDGGGIYLNWNATVRRNLVQHNRAHYGGGISISTNDPVLDGNRVISNTAVTRGGGIYIVASSSAAFNLDNLVVAQNSGNPGAGIYLASGRPTLRHTTIAANQGGDGVGLYIAEYSSSVISATLRNTIIATQTTGVYVANGEQATLDYTLWHSVTNQSGGSGSFQSTHAITGSPSFVNPAGGNYHITDLSQAKDNGASAGVAHDFEEDSRPGGSGYDIGADEYAEAGMLLTKQCDRSLVSVDETLTYTLYLTSTSIVLNNVALTDTLDIYQRPITMTASQGSCSIADAGWGGQAVCNLGTVGAGASVQLTFTARTTSTTPPNVPQIITNTVQATSDEAENSAQASLQMQSCRARLVEGSSVVTYTTIQAAIDAAAYVTSEVQVAGTCIGVQETGGQDQIAYVNKTLFLRGGYSDDFSARNPMIYPTTLHAMDKGRVLYLTGAGITPTIEGLRITGGVGDGGFASSGTNYDAGGGVYVNSGVQAVISGCWVYSNTAHVGISLGTAMRGIGGGIFLYNAGTTIRDTLISSNTASIPGYMQNNEHGYGGGVAIYQSNNALLTGNDFYGNVAQQNSARSGSGYGGGLYLGNSNAKVLTNTLSANTAGHSPTYISYGGGIHVDGGAPTIQGNNITGNAAHQNYRGYGGGISLEGSAAQVISNTVQENTASASSYQNEGGGIALRNGDQSTLRGNRVLTNSANASAGPGVGGGIMIDASGPVTLTGNLIQGNHASENAAGWGGGLEVASNSSVVISGNIIQQNYASRNAEGAGGGVLIESDSSAYLYQNRILTNTAGYTDTASQGSPSGGGVALLSAGAVEMVSNTLRGNIACPFDDGRGGGIYAQESLTVTLTGNIIVSNTASAGNTGSFGSTGRGGGLYVDFESALVVTGDVWQMNVASAVGVGYGGGLYLEDSDLTLYDSDVLSNSTGGGSDGYGGGLYARGDAAISIARARFMENSAQEGGALRFLWVDSAHITNTLIVRNQAAWGAGLLIMGEAHFLHTTIAGNTGDEGVYVSDGADACFINTIIAGHSVGLYADGYVRMDNTLWHDNSTDLVEDEGFVLTFNDYRGDPDFVNPAGGDYHINPGSAALDRGEDEDIAEDIDGEPRPWGSGPDLGADENRSGFTLSPSYDAEVTPGQTITYTHTLRNNGAVADTYTLTFASDRGWAALLTASPVSVIAGNAVAVQVRAVVPVDALYGLSDTALLTATSQTTPTLFAVPTDRTTAGISGTVSLEPDRSASVQSGGSVVYTHTLVNNTNAAQAFTLDAASSQGYTVTIVPSTTGSLPALGGSALVSVTVQTAAGAVAMDTTVVTATGSSGGSDVASDTTTIICTAPTGVSIAGPTTATVGSGVTFTATASPPEATTPITYTWEATGLASKVHTGGGVSDVIQFTWNLTGTKRITVTAVNACGSRSKFRDIIVESGRKYIYLPLVLRNYAP